MNSTFTYNIFQRPRLRKYLEGTVLKLQLTHIAQRDWNIVVIIRHFSSQKTSREAVCCLIGVTYISEAVQRKKRKRTARMRLKMTRTSFPQCLC